MPDENGETRRERNARFGIAESVDIQEPDLSPAGEFLWSVYWSLSSRLRRVRDGVCDPVPPTEFLAWCQITGTILGPIEYDIFCAMDSAFCSVMNDELEALRVRRDEKAKDNGHSRNRVRGKHR
jgi:hypothetical protein